MAADGSVTFEDRHVTPQGLGMAFDLTDELMRNRGMDPYGPAKLEFLDRTRDARAEMGRVYRLQQLAGSAEAMQASIAAVWALPDTSQRKDLLFELWDACAESGEPELVAGGSAARTVLVAFVQRKLIGSAAYTSEDLARLNARRTSASVFDPYRAP